MRTILHITPHLGGGVGRVLLNYIKEEKEDTDFSHKVLCLDYANEKALLAAKTTVFPLSDNMSTNPDRINSEIASSDIVLIHWWNHPLLYAFLVRETLPPCRILFWSHISGLHPPFVFPLPALCYPDIFVFTSPLSFEVPEVKVLLEAKQGTFRTIWSTGGIEHITASSSQPRPGFRIGYIGTVDYSKMHPKFLEMSGMINIPDAEFIVCGGPSEKKIQQESLTYGVEKRWTFTGPVDDINPYLSSFDVFGYPLAPYHYGTCEQSLCEAMAAGVPPVVLANKAERHIVENGFNGIIAENGHDYARAIERLYQDPIFRAKLSSNSKITAQLKFSMKPMARQWKNIFEEILTIPKTKRSWKGPHCGKDVSPAYIFLESLGNHGIKFLQSITAQNEQEKHSAIESIKELSQHSLLWRSDTHGTPSHYHTFFPEDNNLKFWKEILGARSEITSHFDPRIGVRFGRAD